MQYHKYTVFIIDFVIINHFSFSEILQFLILHGEILHRFNAGLYYVCMLVFNPGFDACVLVNM